ncbi:ATP-grasp domain-containing protein [Litchfieldella rifensis]|uniref:Acetyl-CoA carboxylase biotin carboxylase subunit family protein n=1 Tax=Litchfieldella rifensis TaxID=762643 RepID=A0ABV7LI23_9GAMM
MSWNVFVIGFDDLGRRLLPHLRHAEDYAFYGLLSPEKVVHADEYAFDDLTANALAELEQFSGSVDAIVGYWDFPTSTLVPVLRQRLGLPGPSLEAVLKCEHKYWSRLEQKRSVPECVPSFQAVDPFAEDVVAGIHIDYPFWIKPVKAHSSHLGFRIDNADQLREALPRIRAGIGRFGRPLDEVTAHADLPQEVAAVTGHHCIAESIISADCLCTLEGYVLHGEVHLTGVVDSVCDARHRSVLLRYEYPSRLPESVQQRMLDYARRFIEQIGYDNAPFNIEFYHDAKSDRISLLEINPRVSRSNAAIFQLVDSAPHFQVMVDVALGIEPRMSRREGSYPVAAKQMLRVFEDGIVRRIPSSEERQRVEEAFPGTSVEINVHEGMRLSELRHQDSFSWELGVLFIGANSHDELHDRIDQCREMLPFDIEPLPAETPA